MNASVYDGMALEALWLTLYDCNIVMWDSHTTYGDYLAHMERRANIQQAIARRIIKDWEAVR